MQKHAQGHMASPAHSVSNANTHKLFQKTQKGTLPNSFYEAVTPIPNKTRDQRPSWTQV